jgi:HK97 family phage major capsid protein
VPYNNITSRTDAQALIPEEVSNAILGKATEQSAVLQQFRRIPVSRSQVRLPVLSALPVAYWVGGDTGLKQTTEMAWANKFLNVEEIATIMPIPENVAADIDINIWDDAQPYLVEAFARTLDTAVFFGINAPSSFPTNVLAAAVAAGNTVVEGTANAAAGSYMGDLDNLVATVEEDGFSVTGYVSSLAAKRKFRAARNTQGDKTDVGRLSGDLSTFDGDPITYPMRGLWPTTLGTGNNPRLFAGEWDQFVVGVRQDIQFKILTESVIQDNTGAIVYNLPQQDMIALRLKMRVGWQVANTINNDNPTEASRYPAAAMLF